MANIKLKVNWLSERADDNDLNEGKVHGFYIFDCDESEYDPELGFGCYSVLEAFWYETEEERDREYDLVD